MRRLALVLGALVLLVGAAACGGGEEETATPETVVGTLPADTTGGGGGGDGGEGDPANGKSVYASAGCGGCHAFQPAGSTGTAGPSLDDADVDYDEAYDQIEKGGGGMPAFGDRLSDKEIADVAAFVTQGG